MWPAAVMTLILLVLGAAPGMQLAPRDESLGDDSFQAFKAGLQQVARECNERTLYGLVAPDAGILGRVRTWDEQVREVRAETGRLLLCESLAGGLPLGVAQIGNEYCIPYPLCTLEVLNRTLAWPSVTYGRAVVARAESPDDSPPVDALEPWEVVDKCAGQASGPCADDKPACHSGWTRVGTARGRTGCVKERDLIWDLTCVSFKKTPEGWRISSVRCYDLR